MTRTAVKTITDFTFQSDFTAQTPPVEDTADTVSVTANELAELLANARNEGMAAADARHDHETAEKLTTMSKQLKSAMEELLKLIVNGQRDLFADQ